MSKQRSPLPFLILLFAGFAAESVSTAETANGDSPFKGNRRPGIMEAATEVPMGENALLYRRMGNLKPNELLDLVSESPRD